jgi:hypothetical protein
MSQQCGARYERYFKVGTELWASYTLSGKEYSSSKSDKSRRKKADEKKGSKMDPKKRENGNTHNPKTAKKYRMEMDPRNEKLKLDRGLHNTTSEVCSVQCS